MFSKREIIQYFPSCVWVHELQDFEDMNGRLSRTVYGLRDAQTPGGTARAWRSEHDLHKLEEFQPLNRIVLTAARGVLEFLKYRYERFEITRCWADIDPGGGAGAARDHPNNLLSGLYCLQAPENCGEIRFQDPRRQAGVLLPRVKTSNPFNARQEVVTPRDGRLLVFPAWFQHMLDPNRGAQDRVTIGFTIMLRGEVGYESGSAEF